MTFYRYKIISRSADTLEQAYFSLWMDGDLGCEVDDYVGCDTSRSLIYYYNTNAQDSCFYGYGYGYNIPIFGVDLLRGPFDEDGNELSMSSFIYNNNYGVGTPPLGTTDPGSSPAEFYNLMVGLWKDGSPLYAGNDGYQDAQYPITKYAFFDAPDDINGWSMAQEDLADGDRRTIQSTGPFSIQPGFTNEIVYGIPWVPNVPHPAPSLTSLLAADDKAQALFDGCFADVMATETQEQFKLSIFPNPASDYIHIQSSENRENVQIQLVSMSGQVVLSQKVDINKDVSISHLPQGVYGYQVRDLKGRFLGSGTLVKK